MIKTINEMWGAAKADATFLINTLTPRQNANGAYQVTIDKEDVRNVAFSSLRLIALACAGITAAHIVSFPLASASLLGLGCKVLGVVALLDVFKATINVESFERIMAKNTKNNTITETVSNLFNVVKNIGKAIFSEPKNFYEITVNAILNAESEVACKKAYVIMATSDTFLATLWNGVFFTAIDLEDVIRKNINAQYRT